MTCCSCGFFGDQHYECDGDTVDAACIVEVGDYNQDENRFNYTVLAEIVDVTEFIEQVNDLDHSVNWGDPGTFFAGDVAIKIDYSNGDYDLLGTNAQIFIHSGNYKYGYFFFDKEQFVSIIDQYI